jgi:hypothetical protein
MHISEQIMNKDRLKNLTVEEKIQLIKKVKKKENAPKTNAHVFISAYSRNQPIPASVIQQEIWFHENLVKESNAYNIPIALEVSGKLNYEALTQTLRIILNRYEIMRTSFYTIDGIPYQKLHQELDLFPQTGELSLNIVNLKDLSSEVQEQKVEEILFQFSKKSFDLSKAPLFRFIVIEKSPSSYVLSFVIHHIICDNWSLTLLIQEILRLYYASSNGQELPDFKPNFQYADYCFWEKEMLTTHETQLKIDYLKKHLQSLNFDLKLPHDYPKNPQERAQAKSKQFIFIDELPKKISAFCAKNDLTPYIFFLAVYHALLFKYSFQPEIVIGTSFLNRPSNDNDGVLGAFINVALINSKIDKDTTFLSLAAQVRNTVLDMHAYRFIPLNKMIKSMNSMSRRDLSLTQVFYGFLNFKINQITASSSSEISIKLLNQSNELRVYNSAKFELDLTIWEDETNMGGSLEYMCNVFKEETIDLILQHYKQICALVVEDCHLRIEDINLSQKMDDSLKAEDAFFAFT